MADVAIGLLILYGALAVGVRMLIHLRTTGSAGFRGMSGRPGSAEWYGGVLFVLSWVVVGIGAGVEDGTEPLAALDGPAADATGVALYTVGLIGTLAAQRAMGRSWRIGVDEAERTELVTGGLFALARNPIYTAMITAVVGIGLIVPNAVALAGIVALVLSLEIQVRLVEEPYLLRSHGGPYARYAARVGRFLPGLGRL